MSLLQNHVRLSGMLGQDAVKRDFAQGGSVVNLRVATIERWTDRATGEPKEMTDWHSVAVLADRAVKRAQHLRKGDWVEIDGKLQTRKYQKDGRDHYVTEVIVRGPDHRILVLPKRQPDGASAEPQQEQAPAPSPGEIDDHVPF
jgi:single-strand DNA-binding protein